MARDIAVFIGDNGSTVSLEEPGKIVVYRRKQGKWRVVDALLFRLDHTSGMAGVQRQLLDIIQWLGQCRVFVAQTVVGLLYKELDRNGFSIWEFTGYPTDFLEYILAQEELAAREGEPANPTAPAIVETGPGCFRVSLKDIQQSGSGLTSKQVLQPLLTRNYYEVEVLCSHIPPWLEAEWESGRLDCKAERFENGVKLVIRKQRCG